MQLQKCAKSGYCLQACSNTGSNTTCTSVQTLLSRDHMSRLGNHLRIGCKGCMPYKQETESELACKASYCRRRVAYIPHAGTRRWVLTLSRLAQWRVALSFTLLGAGFDPTLFADIDGHGWLLTADTSGDASAGVTIPDHLMLANNRRTISTQSVGP